MRVTELGCRICVLDHSTALPHSPPSSILCSALETNQYRLHQRVLMPSDFQVGLTNRDPRSGDQRGSGMEDSIFIWYGLNMSWFGVSLD